MDLDFSFELVSSLTPRSHTTRSQIVSNSEPSTKRTGLIKGTQGKFPIGHLSKQDDKENKPTSDQLRNRSERTRRRQSKNGETKKVLSGDSNISALFPIDMVNIAVRKNRVKKYGTLNSPDRGLRDCNKESQNSTESSSEAKDSFITATQEKNTKFSLYDVSNEDCEVINTLQGTGIKKTRTSTQQIYEQKKSSLSSCKSLDLIESSFSELEIKLVNNFSSELKLSDSKKSPRFSGNSENSFSPAYDSDSLPITKTKQVVPETPESDEQMSKSSIDNRNQVSNNETYGKSEMNFVVETESQPKAKLLSNSESESVVTNMFKLKSSIQNHSAYIDSQGDNKNGLMKKPIINYDEKSDQLTLPVSPDLKESKCKNESLVNHTIKNEGEINFKLTNKGSFQNKKQSANNSKLGSSVKTNKLLLKPPSELIPKLEHINNWLEAQEKPVIVLSSDSSPEKLVIKKKKQKKRKSKVKISLSPRIESKIKVAKKSLEEEQQVFEELYRDDSSKRYIGGIDDEPVSISSSQDSVELSENALEKIYGTVLQKQTDLLSQTEPRKHTNNTKKIDSQSTSKKSRTSIYDEFYSSSSEDRFEHFLESVKKGKFKPKRQSVLRRNSNQFINDSDSDTSCSPTFYQNIVSSTVKEDINKLQARYDNLEEDTNTAGNRRRLSFSSYKDDNGSESNRSGKNTKHKDKSKSRSKKETGTDKRESPDEEVNVFTLVTPLKIKKKKTEKDVKFRIQDFISSDLLLSGGKYKTPKKLRTDDMSKTEEKLRAKYLGECDFKVPKDLNGLKTPKNTPRRDVPSSPALSFLSSLSEVTSGLPCHPDALAYKKSFTSKREELTKKLFALYNKEVFEYKLPLDMLIQWNNRMRSTSGYCYNKRTYVNKEILRSSRIVLSTKILDRADRLRDTLIHELCHAATWIINGTSDGHGPNWKAWADKANRRFPELPIIKRCHDYAISTKYTYKCMTCGYCIGRHSKSLDIERKRCGYCYGMFQVFLTAKMSTASVTSGSDSVKTPRNPTGFALFVKDNYASIKKEHNVPHAQVMKMLSQKFSEVKISRQKAEENIFK